MEVTVPDQFMGDIMGDLNKKRGRIQGMEARAASRSSLPPRWLNCKYAIDLRSMTQVAAFTAGI